MVQRGWFGSQNGVRGVSLEGVCFGAMVLHNMERGKFDFKETQTPGVGSGSQACVNPEELMVLKEDWGGRHWLSVARGPPPPVDSPSLSMLFRAPRDTPLFTFSAFPF